MPPLKPDGKMPRRFRDVIDEKAANIENYIQPRNDPNWHDIARAAIEMLGAVAISLAAIADEIRDSRGS